MNIKEFRFDVNPLSGTISLVHIPNSSTLFIARLSGNIDWEKLIDVVKRNINALSIQANILQLLFGETDVQIINLEDNEIIAQGKIKLDIDWIKIASLIIKGKL